MKSLLLVAAVGLFTGLKAQAETFYFVNGAKSSAGEAERTLQKDPNAVVLKIQANKVGYSDKTGNLKKTEDPTDEQLKSIKF